MKAKPESIDGPEAWKSFEGLMQKVITVSHEEMLRREAEYRKQVDANPNRRGPRRKAKDKNPSSMIALSAVPHPFTQGHVEPRLNH